MSINVLVADDSATIQKVVSITLANESVNLISCESENELFNKVKEGNIQAVLLDFGLSHDQSGFDLISSILSVNTNIKILTMIPAFEQVDEARLSDCGSFGSIAKPFESSKFINVFREMLTTIDHIESGSDSEDWLASSTTDSKIGEVDELKEDVSEFDPDEWVSNTSFTDHSQVTEASPVEAALVKDEIEVEHQLSDFEMNELSETISDWGIEIPSPIKNQNASGPFFPPIIDSSENTVLNEDENEFASVEDDISFDEPIDRIDEETKQTNLTESVDEWSMPNQKFEDLSDENNSSYIEQADSEFEREEELDENEVEESTIYPDDDDLAYPDFSADLKDEQPDNVHIEPLSDNEEEVLNDEPIIFDNPSAVPASKRRYQAVNSENLELATPFSSETNISKRDSLDLEQEVESDIDPDHFWEEDTNDNLQSTKSAHSSIDRNSFQSQISNVDIDKFFNEIKLELLERVDRTVREVCEEKIEKVAWEVIPEIAENLIKKEIKLIQQDEECR